MFNDIPHVKTKIVCDDSAKIWEIYVEYDFNVYAHGNAWEWLQHVNFKLVEISELLEQEKYVVSFVVNKTSRFAGNAKITFYKRDDFLLFKLKL